MHKSIVALIVIMAIAVASIPTNANARRIGYGWRSAGWMGPGVGLPPWGWRGQGWDGYYVYSPSYYGYGLAIS
jgi:hypothetical protein